MCKANKKINNGNSDYHSVIKLPDFSFCIPKDNHLKIMNYDRGWGIIIL